MSKTAKLPQHSLSHTKSFVYTPTNTIPSLPTLKTEWDLNNHYYKSANDPQIEQDARGYERSMRSFIKKYKTINFTSSAGSLLTALRDNDKRIKDQRSHKIMRYFSFRTIINVNDTEATRKLHQYGDRFRKISTEFTFFSLAISKTPKQLQKQYLKDKSLAQYHFLLKELFADGKYLLSEKEENILKLRSKTSSDMWADATEKIISNRQVTYKNKTYQIPEALEILDTLSWKEKESLWENILEQMIQISEFAEHELTAIVNHDKVSDELRGYRKPYSATVRNYQNNEAAVEALVEAISTKGFALSRKFYRLKAKLHSRDTIPYVNKYDSIGSLPQPDFETSVAICRDVFYGLKPAYGKIFDRLLSSGQVDVYPRAGKQGGAFMAASTGLPTYIKLNHVSNFKSLETLAHEMGHAVHAECSKIQPAIYEDFSTTTAETASTLFEQLVTEHLLENLPTEQQIVVLHDKIARDIATVQRQIAFFNFELKMHQHIRREGIATKTELAKLMEESLRAYLGPAVEVSERDGYSFVFIPHVRYGFYVYTYTYGHLVSNLMLQRYHTDHGYLEKVDNFLHAGASDTVENIFQAAGINTKKVETFTDSLKTQAAEIKRLTNLI